MNDFGRKQKIALLISNLTTDYKEEAAFKSIGRRLRELAADLEKLAKNED